MRRFTVHVLVVCSLGALPGCDQDCDVRHGPCPMVSLGDKVIVREPRLDGLFAAVVELGERLDSMRVELESDLRDLAELYDVDASLPLADLAAAVRAAIESDLATNTQGDLYVARSPMLCAADAPTARGSFARCTGLLGVSLPTSCLFEIGPFACDGQCHGSCSGACSLCADPVDGACAGVCEGSCYMVAGGACAGVCLGVCAGTCSLSDADGQCHGLCDGTCTGSCLIPGGDSCSGDCCGDCVSEPGSDGGCDGRCAGTCDGDCSGRCAGVITPICATDSEEAAGCTAQATARAAVAGRCDPGAVDLWYELDAAVDVAERGCFEARLARVKEVLVRAGRRTSELRWLVQGDPELGVPAATVTVQTMIEALRDGGWEEYHVPSPESPCATFALEDSIEILASVPTWSEQHIEPNADLASILGFD